MTQRFYVIKVDVIEPRHFFHAGGSDYSHWSQRQEETEGQYYDRDTVLFGPTLDTQSESERLAKALAGQFPGNSYAVVDTQSVFYCEPGNVQQAKFTDKGFLPV